MNKYFVFGCTEDGVSITVFNSKAELLKALSTNNETNPDRELWFDNILEKFPDGEYWDMGNDIVIIKGDYVVPTPKEAVTVYEIE